MNLTLNFLESKVKKKDIRITQLSNKERHTKSLGETDNRSEL